MFSVDGIESYSNQALGELLIQGEVRTARVLPHLYQLLIEYDSVLTVVGMDISDQSVRGRSWLVSHVVDEVIELFSVVMVEFRLSRVLRLLV